MTEHTVVKDQKFGTALIGGENAIVDERGDSSNTVADPVKKKTAKTGMIGMNNVLHNQDDSTIKVTATDGEDVANTRLIETDNYKLEQTRTKVDILSEGGKAAAVEVVNSQNTEIQINDSDVNIESRGGIAAHTGGSGTKMFVDNSTISVKARSRKKKDHPERGGD